MMPRHWNLRASALLLLGLSGLVAGCGSGGGSSLDSDDPASTRPPKASEVTGRYILSVSDADMDATAVVTRALTEPESAGGSRGSDALTIITLPIREPQTPWSQIAVSNSALGPPHCVAASRDGNYAYVVETRGPAPAGATRVEELPPGETLTTVDLRDPLKPRIADARFVGFNPSAVDVHPDGDLLAIVNTRAREQLVLVPLENGKPAGDAFSWPLLGLDDDAARPACVAWHPSGRALAITLPERNQVVLYTFTKDAGDGSFGLAPWGLPVATDKYPSSCVFTPDGRFLITSNLHWGSDVEGFFVGAPVGTVSSIRVADDLDRASVASTHTVLSTVPVGINPEGLALNPDGNVLVTANLLRSFLPDSDARLTRGGSLSLVAINPDSGLLRSISETPLMAMPEGLAFDASGKYVVVTLYRSFDPSAQDGELGFFRLRGSGTSRPSLQPADFWVGVGKNPHGVLIVR